MRILLLNSALFNVLLVLVLLCVAPASAEIADIEQKADHQKLASDPQWLALLHYRDGKSEADDPRFFLSPDGKSDSAAELRATLEHLQDSGSGDDSPQCRFVARYDWLREALQLDPQRFPAPNCPSFQEWFAEIAPHALTLVYPASYLNNPASAFGHAFLRIDAASQTDQTRLLAYGASYAANTGGESMGFVYAFKAMVGLYVGNFALTPYYMQVRKYSDLENRDIWEYSLSLSPDEVALLVRHLWELREIGFDYYFFDENCASQLLTLLNVARPSLQLGQRFALAVMPIDTVREIAAEPGLIARAIYRPAGSTVLRAQMRELNAEDIVLARKLAAEEIAESDWDLSLREDRRRAAILELAAEFLRYEMLASGGEPSAAQKKAEHGLLLARSALAVTSKIPTPPPSIRPDEAHRTSRVSLGLGDEEGDGYIEFRLRPAFHEQIDFEPGYPRGSELEFLDTTFRWYEDERLKIERFAPIHIVSLAPRNALIAPISWTAAFDAERLRFDDEERNLVYRLHGGPGLSYELSDTALGYGLVRLAAMYSPDFDRNFGLGGEVEVGTYGDLTEELRLRVRAVTSRSILGTEFSRWNLALDSRYALTRQTALRLEIQRFREFDNYALRGQVSFDVFF